MTPPISPLTLHAEPLNHEQFAPFGSIVSVDEVRGRSVNQGRAARVPGVDDLAHDPAAHRPVLDVYHVMPSQLPFALICLERHPLSAQVFVPMCRARLLVVVAPDDASGHPDMSRARAFINESASIIHYRAGVWHAPLVALQAEARLAMLMWEAGTAQDCEELALPTPIAVTG